MKTGPKPKPPLDRFMNFVMPGSSCWEWGGAKYPNGYGMFRIGSLTDGSRKQVLAHRWIYQFTHNVKLTKEIFVCHHCDNKSCVNPDHLFIGTNSDNIKDCVKKGIFGKRNTKGIKNPNSKLSEQNILKIRKMSDAGYPNAHIARTFSISKTHVGHIVSRKNWSHI